MVNRHSDPPVITRLVNEEPGENVPQKVFNGFVRIMRGALAGAADYFLILEDDILIARNFRAAVMAWPLFLEGSSSRVCDRMVM